MESASRKGLVAAAVIFVGSCCCPTTPSNSASTSAPPSAPPTPTGVTPPATSCPSAAPHITAAYTALHSTPPQPVAAQSEYTQALSLHDGGCRLTDGDLWSTLEGLALAHFYQGQFAAALPHLRRAAQLAPTVDETHYNLACALCRTGDTNGCYQELETTLTVAAAGRPPPFMEASRMFSAAHYARNSHTDPDLAALRTDPRYEPLVARYAAVTSPGRP